MQCHGQRLSPLAAAGGPCVLCPDHASTVLELLGCADQLQPARPRTRNTDEALPKQGASVGCLSVGCAVPQPLQPHVTACAAAGCQNVSSCH